MTWMSLKYTNRYGREHYSCCGGRLSCCFLLSYSLHIALLYLLGLLLLPLAFTYPFIQNFVLKRKKYVENLIEQYKTMEPDEQRSLAREGWYRRFVPVIGFAVLLFSFMIYSALT